MKARNAGGVVALAAILGILLVCSSAGAHHSLTEVVSTGPAGGNGALSSTFRGTSADGSRVVFQTSEALVTADTDTRTDVYERSAGTTTLLSTGPTGGNGAFTATYAGQSQDGSRVIFRTSEKLVASDTDSVVDLYERAAGVTTLVSTGPAGGNGLFTAVFDGISLDGSRVIFETDESLVSGDSDEYTDVYQRSGGTTTLLSTGPAGGNDELDAAFDGMSQDATRVFFSTDEALTSSDTDVEQDVYQRFGSTTTHLSIGPDGGNGDIDNSYMAFFAGASADGSLVWLTTDEVLISSTDTDAVDDIYERTGASLTQVSVGPGGGNGAISPFFDGASADGSRVFFDTTESLVTADTDTAYDVYERAGGTTTLISTGPDGGNGPIYSSFGGASADGTKVFFQTPDSLLASDTDGQQDVYQRSGGTTTLISTGPQGGNGAFPANYNGASKDGSRVFFDTGENLTTSTSGFYPDVYERAGTLTTVLSVGYTGGSGDFFAFFEGASDDGTKVFFHTSETLLSSDTDEQQDVYSSSIPAGFPRPKGATPLRVGLVPAYNECTAPNRTHGPALAHPSCNPPTQLSGFLTIGSPDANGVAANSQGSIKYKTINGNPATPADEADLSIAVSLTDVRRKSDIADYTGEIQVRTLIRITDKLNGGPTLTESATVSDVVFPVTVPCATTPSTSIGSACTLATTADAVMPGAITEVKRTIWEFQNVEVMDGGSDGQASTAGNTLFAKPGIFIP